MTNNTSLIIKCIGFIFLFVSFFKIKIKTEMIGKYTKLYYLFVALSIILPLFIFCKKYVTVVPVNSKMIKHGWSIIGTFAVIISIIICLFFKNTNSVKNKILFIGAIIYVISEFHDLINYMK